MKKYSAMAMFDRVIPEHRDVYLAEEVEAEIDEILKAVSEMECTCLPYAEITGEGRCQRCLLLNKHY